MFPAGLLAAAADTRADPRRVATQAERDTAALQLAERRAMLQERLRQALRYDRLAAASRGRLAWYLEEVGKAATMDRLRALAERLATERATYLPPTELVRHLSLPATAATQDDEDEVADGNGKARLSWSAAAAELLGERPALAAGASPLPVRAAPPAARWAGGRTMPQPGQSVAARAAGAGEDYRPCQSCRSAQRRGPDGRWANAVARIEADRPVPGLPGLTVDVCGYCLTMLDARQIGYGIAERYPATTTGLRR